MDDKRLRALLTAVQCGSFGKATAQLGYTQSAMTHLVNKLEAEVGCTLLERVRQADALTVTLEQRTADFRLQFVDQMCHCGLGIAQLRRRFAEAAAIDRRQQGAKFTVVHTLPPYLHFASPSYHEFVSISHKITEKE